MRSGTVLVSDGKSTPESAKLNLTLELLTLQKLDTSTPTINNEPPSESKVRNHNFQILKLIKYIDRHQVMSLQYLMA